MAHASTTEIKNPGAFKEAAGLNTLFYVMIAVGVITFAVSLGMDSKRAWATFLQNHFYFMSLAVGGLFFAAIQWITGAMWSAPVRRVGEAFTAYLPIAIGSFLILAIGGLSKLYIWTDHELVSREILLSAKSGYLSPAFFIVRNVAAVLIWIYFAKKMVGNSIAQDTSKDTSISGRNRKLAPIFLMLFAFSFTFAAFDQLMSLDPYWFSTMFGVYCFAGMFYSTLAMIAILTITLKRRGYLEGIVNDNHLHDLGKLMFAFVVFWAYIGFSQFMLIWYANMPEETGYFLHRMHGGWMGVSIFLLVGKFFAPFAMLLPRGSKRSESRLLFVATWMLVAQWIDVLWLVQPEFFKEGPKVGIPEIGVAIGFLGLFGFMVTRFLSKNNVVAIGDPKLAESVFHHHQ